MDAPSADPFERVRESLLHLGLRQITEEPGPNQPADFARRKARFKQNRRDLDEFRAKQSAARVAADARIDNELRAKLEGHDGCGINRPARPVVATSHTITYMTRPVNQMQGSLLNDGGTVGRRSSLRLASRLKPATLRGPPSRRVSKSGIDYDRGKSVMTVDDRQPKFLTIDTDDRHAVVPSPSSSVTPPGIEDIANSTRDAMPGMSSNLIISQDSAFSYFHDARTVSKLNKIAYQPVHGIAVSTSRSTESNPVDRTRSSQIDSTDNSTTATPSRISSHTADYSVRSDDRDAIPHYAPEAAATTSPTTSSTFLNIAFTNSGPTSDLNNDISRPSNEQRGADDLVPISSASAPQSGCTSKHFRIRKITGRQSIDGDTYYIVAWRSSWVPSDLIKSSGDGQERCIRIDGRDWRIAGTIKTRVKKGVFKDLVRWVDDTLEPIKRLRRAISAIEEFELKPRLDRRVVSFDESLVDQTKILHQPNEHFREAQVHCAKKWPIIQPRNDIDLLPALRQIFQEQSPRRDNETTSRKTHQRLIDQPQLRRLCWNEEYLLAGRFYECTQPKRNALLLQVVAEGVGDGCCERCVTDIAPFKECVRDTSEDNPWLNGACANCGTAEANSTCCHHLVGTAHLERGRSKGLTSERLRELIDPTRSIELLKRLEYEDDDESDTYSADSYAESDTSSAWERERSDDHHTINDSDGDDQHDESTINNFCAPGAPSEDELNSARQYFAASSTNGSGGLFVSPGAQSINLFNVRRDARMRERPTSRNNSVSHTSDVTQAHSLPAVATGSRRSLVRDVVSSERSSWFDRSSVTMAAVNPASGRRYDNTSGPSGHHDTSVDSQLPDVDDMYGNMDPHSAQRSPSQDATTRQTVSPASITTIADSRVAAIQSVEVFGRVPSSHISEINAVPSDGPQASFQGPRSRKRAASQPSEYEPATFRSSTGSLRSSRGAFNHSDGDVKSPRAEESPVNTIAGSSSTGTKLGRGSTHEGCRANWPCRHPDHATPDDGTLVIVYRDTIDDTSQFTTNQIQYILSRCTCHWASAFTKVWDGWCEEPDASVEAELTKPQYLLLYWAERLLDAAKECCPTYPRNREVIVID